MEQNQKVLNENQKKVLEILKRAKIVYQISLIVLVVVLFLAKVFKVI